MPGLVSVVYRRPAAVAELTGSSAGVMGSRAAEAVISLETCPR
jgi:hypothetical protein